MTDENGNFKLPTYDTNDGAFWGTNSVVLSEPIEPTKALIANELFKYMKNHPEPKAAIPGKYSDPKKSPQKNTVKAGQIALKIELED